MFPPGLDEGLQRLVIFRLPGLGVFELLQQLLALLLLRHCGVGQFVAVVQRLADLRPEELLFDGFVL
ncbi:Uncharacterised protein [Mycobacterium tuberculosis]|nr:Uncharacterised protein [Mycobacterium tuberculosis]